MMWWVRRMIKIIEPMCVLIASGLLLSIVGFFYSALLPGLYPKGGMVRNYMYES